MFHKVENEWRFVIEAAKQGLANVPQESFGVWSVADPLEYSCPYCGKDERLQGQRACQQVEDCMYRQQYIYGYPLKRPETQGYFRIEAPSSNLRTEAVGRRRVGCIHWGSGVQGHKDPCCETTRYEAYKGTAGLVLFLLDFLDFFDLASIDINNTSLFFSPSSIFLHPASTTATLSSAATTTITTTS